MLPVSFIKELVSTDLLPLSEPFSLFQFVKSSIEIITPLITKKLEPASGQTDLSGNA